MSARSAFENEYGIKSEYDQELLEAVLAEYAHKLAEKIRQEPGPDDADQKFLIYNNGWYDARQELADLIDPEVE